MERESKAIEVRHKNEIDMLARETREESDQAAKKLSHRVRELEKAIEVQRVTATERLNMALDLKDKEIS